MASIGRPQSRGQMLCGKRITVPSKHSSKWSWLAGSVEPVLRRKQQQRRQCCNPGPGAWRLTQDTHIQSSDCDLRLQKHVLAFLLFLLSSPLFRWLVLGNAKGQARGTLSLLQLRVMNKPQAIVLYSFPQPPFTGLFWPLVNSWWPKQEGPGPSAALLLPCLPKSSKHSGHCQFRVCKTHNCFEITLDLEICP